MSELSHSDVMLMTWKKALRHPTVHEYDRSGYTTAMQYLHLAETQAMPPVVTIQNPYNLLNRSFEIGLAEIEEIHHHCPNPCP